MIVDDELHMRVLRKETLEEFEDKGVTLLLAENEEHAIESIKTEKTAHAILGAIMPGIDGFEVCDIVNNSLGVKDVSVLMFTAD